MVAMQHFTREHVGCNMLHKEVKNLENITNFGGEWCANYHKISYPFWKAVFSYWADFWNVDLELDVDKTILKNIYPACFYTIKYNTFIWLQNRIIGNKILGTSYYLKKKSPTAIFVKYVNIICQVSDQWTNIKHRIECKLKIRLNWHKITCILGYSLCDVNFYPLNFILMIVRHYIFKCALKIETKCIPDSDNHQRKISRTGTII